MKYEQQHTTHEKLLQRLKKQGECLVYTGHKTQDGYGTFMTFGVTWRAHRYFYNYYVGDIPEDLLVLHSCDNRPCVLPSHLRVGTASDNMKDMGERNKTRTYGPARQSHCKRGHERTPENIWIGAAGQPKCRVCRKQNRIKKQQESGFDKKSDS